ncbi:hypothetical protein HMI56_004076, partial [Coelomomyces lativittatus]
KTFFEYVKHSETQKIDYAISWLTGTASLWWYAHKPSTPIKNWEEFKITLRDRFTPPDIHQRWYEELYKLKYSGNITQYYSNFQGLVQRIGGFSREDLVKKFLRGLPEKMEEFCLGNENNLVSLESLFKAC